MALREHDRADVSSAGFITGEEYSPIQQDIRPEFYFPRYPTLRQVRSRRLNALIAAHRAEKHAEERCHGEHAPVTP